MDGNTWALVAIALLNAVTAWLTYSAKRDIHEVKIATNGINAALVESTAKASHAEGKEAGRLTELDRAATEKEI